MRFPRACLFLRLLLSIALIIAFAPCIHAQRRDFAGSYRLSNVVPSSDQVELTITLKLLNYSGADIHNAGIVLYDASREQAGAALPGNELRDTHQNEPIGAFKLIELFPSYKQITLTHRFTVPAAEYARWQHGHEPDLVFLKPGVSTDGEASASSVHIDLKREFVPGETFPQGSMEVAR